MQNPPPPKRPKPTHKVLTPHFIYSHLPSSPKHRYPNFYCDFQSYLHLYDSLNRLTVMHMSQLPVEVLADILSRLAVKPLLQFRCVSTSWRSLIDSSDFVKQHLNNSIQTQSNLSLILRDRHLHEVGFDSLHAGATAVAVKLDHHPLRCQDYETEVWGSCNGIVCLSNVFDTVSLWNPATRQSRNLPYAAVEFENASKYPVTRIYGFGYDCVSCDYKVVRIVVLNDKDNGSYRIEVKIYSVKSNSWHRGEKIPMNPNFKRSGGVLVNGALHWVGTERIDSQMGGLIVVFDLDSEKFRFASQPDYPDMNFILNMESLGGCLSLSCNYLLNKVDIWVMKEYGVKESWTKLISVNQLSDVGFFQFLRPVSYSKSGENVLLELDAEKLVWYDIAQKTVKKVKVRGVREILQAKIYLGTLVSLNGRREGEGDTKKKQVQGKKKMNDFLSKGFRLVL